VVSLTRRIATALLAGAAILSFALLAVNLETRRRAAEQAWTSRLAELEPDVDAERDRQYSRVNRLRHRPDIDLVAEKKAAVDATRKAWERAYVASLERERTRSWRWYLDNLLATKSLPPP
jgi:hypothetical protein